jgi:hypothetical protein
MMEEELRIEESASVEYVLAKGWKHVITNGQIVTDCPLCSRTGKFYISVESKIRDGINIGPCWDCKVCGRSGTLKSLKKELGDPIPGLVSVQDVVNAATPAAPLPDLNEHHVALMASTEPLDYLAHERGYSIELIEKMRLGLWKHPTTQELWVIYPYINNGKYVYAKMRRLPPSEKAFHGSKGRENPLYHADAIKPDAEEIILTEGEADCLALINQGYECAVGVPGAGMKKAVWIDRLDVWWELRSGKPRRIYILYDSDKPGQEACSEITKRIGIEKVLVIKLPSFTKKDGKPGKDINEFFVAGHTKEEFEAIKNAAKPLDVPGAKSILNVLDELQEEIEGRNTNNTGIDSPWPSFNELFGTCEFGDVFGIIAEGKVGKTTFALNWMEYLVDIKKLPSLFLCLEMPQKRVARKWVSHVTQTDDDQITVDTVQIARDKIIERTTDMILGHCCAQKTEEVFDLIKQAIRRYGIKVLVLDNLQLLVRSIMHSAQETSVLSKRIKEMAIELGIFIILVIQPKRVNENEIVAARHAANSSAIEKDVDYMACLHRNRIGVIKAADFQGLVEQEENFSPYLLVRLDLSRYSAGGAKTFYMEGSKSTVRELKPEEAKAKLDSVIESQPGVVPVEKTSGMEGL